MAKLIKNVIQYSLDNKKMFESGKNNRQQDLTLQFYEQRCRRNSKVKQHTLLKKNVSYFQQKELNEDSKYQMEKVKENNQNLVLNKQNNYNINQTIQNYRPRQRSYLTKNRQSHDHLHQLRPKTEKRQLENEKTLLFNYQSFKRDNGMNPSNHHQELSLQIMNTPSFDQINDQNKIQLCKQPKQIKEVNKKEIQLEVKVRQLEKKLKTQSKFIESIQKMKKTIENTDNECSLHELWQWIKKLPKQSQ